MKEEIMSTFQNLLGRINNGMPDTKKVLKSIDISDVYPFDMNDYLKVNNIPPDAYFSSDTDENPVISYEVEVPMTEAEKESLRKRRFNTFYFKYVYDLLIPMGYKRRGFNSGELSRFDGTTVYDMFINKEYDRLMDYFSLAFGKV